MNRDYQQAAIDAFFDHYFKGHKGNPLIVAPTGVGKSHMLSGICEEALRRWPHVKILVVTHVKELVQQNYNKLRAAWPNGPIGIYSAGLKKRDRFSAVTYCSIQSIQRKPEIFGHVDIVLVDEAHTISPEEETGYQKFFAGLKKINPSVAIGGLTATPWRMGFGPIWGQEGALFERKAIDLGTLECFNWFIDQGYLVPVIPRRTRTEIDVSGVHLTGGEYNLKALQDKVNRREITEAALQQCIDECGEMDSWLIFCSGVQHAIDTAEILTDMGVECKAVHTNMTDTERDDILADFKAGRIQAVANNNILTTGFDHPGLKLIVVLRPTMSSILWVQMIGRGTRPNYADGFDLSTQEGRIEAIRQSDKQYCMVYDFSANSRKLGPINDPVVPRRKGEKGGEAPIKECPKCQTYNHAKATHCIFCNYEFTFEVKLEKKANHEDLLKKGKNDMPIIEEFAVDRISCVKKDATASKPASLRVVYYCGYKMYNEWVCFEHEPGSFPQKRAATWWRLRSDLPVPSTVDEAEQLLHTIKVPTHIRVHTNLKYPEIKAVDFKGTAFGKQEPEERKVEILVEGQQLNNVQTFSDEDIPF